MLSRTTTELSTSIPIPIATPPMEIMFILISVTYIRAKVAMMDVGMETAMIPAVTAFFRNSSRKNAMTAAKSAVSVILDRDISI